MTLHWTKRAVGKGQTARKGSYYYTSDIKGVGWAATRAVISRDNRGNWVVQVPGHAKQKGFKKVTTAKAYVARIAKKLNENPAVKMRTIKGSTGWINGDAFRIVRRGGKTTVLVRRKKGGRR